MGLRETLEAATPLAQQFAKVREWLPESAEVLPMDERNPFAALSVIERHVQDMASLLDEISMKPYRAEEIVARYRERKP